MRNFRDFIAVFTIVLSLIDVIASLKIHSLDGNDWFVFDSNKQSNSLPAKVPGTIYSDLENNFIIDNIYRDDNDVKYRWISYANWTYSKHFNVPANLLKYQQIYLTCHGLDTIANVTLNGYHLGYVDNQFVRYRFPIKPILNEQQNILTISFRSAPNYARDYFLQYDYAIPPVCPPESQNGECHPNFIRKMQASFSWDWGPAFPTQGIWQPITIEAYDKLLIRSISVGTIYERQSDQWLLNTTVWLESRPQATLTDATIILSLAKQMLIMQKFRTKFNVDGESSVNIFIMIPKEMQIRPWFPNGVGDQTLYELNVTIHDDGRNEIVDKQIAIGFRTIELVQDRLNASVEAYSFYFRVNGIPIYSKGSNWIPAHVLNENVKPEYVQYLLWSAKMANMNMLRVWGGGIYESDYFYELADKFGILIWHDMMFACALYPSDQSFLRSVSIEIRQQIRRLQYHPSIALWAGNNENEMAIAGMWWPELAVNLDTFKKDYLKLYIETIAPIVAAEDSTRPFVPSSPSNGVVSHRENYISRDPQNNRYGDNHHYIQFGDAWNWRHAPSAKFVSEYGFQSLPSLELLIQYLNIDDLKYPLTKGLLHREHQLNGIEYLLGFMEQQLPMPTIRYANESSLKLLDDFIYLSQVFQSMAIKIQTEFYRRNRQIDYQTGKGFTMGALYWQLNNIWPGFSWSSIEYEGKWKMLHYFVEKMFDNLLVDVFEDNDNNLNIVIIRDDHSHQSSLYDKNDGIFMVTIEVYNYQHMQPLSINYVRCKTRPFDVTTAYRINLADFLRKSQCFARNDCFVHVKINGTIDRQQLQRENFLLLSNFKHMNLVKDAKIFVVKVNGPSKNGQNVYVYDLELYTDNISIFVWLELLHIDNTIPFALYSDNGFIMTDNYKKLKIYLSKPVAKDKLLSSLTIKSMNNYVQ